ncbi:hypothetical protein DIPPA_14210 [Diplonema papillatum]|nr:hypothetical protein DIPPA_14210 [Diplonema papillatum]
MENEFSLPNPWICPGGTYYNPFKDGDTIFYNLWGVDSSDSRHKWILTADASGGYQYTNEATHQVLVELPDVPQNERPLSVSEKHRLMLRAFYETFQESQIAEVPKLIFYYHENEEKLFMDLFKIFDPEAWPLHYQLLDLYAEKAPEKIGNIPQALAQYKGREAELLGKLANLYTGGVPLRMPPPLPPTPEGYKQRLTAFYEKTSPEQIPHVDNILAAHAANYDELMEKLAGQCPEYAHLLLPGEPERVSEVASPDPANAASPEPVQDVTKSPYYRQVYEFYSQHNPAKLTSLTEVLQAYAGREEDLIKALHGRYDQPYSPEESERTRQRLAQQGDNDFLSVSRCRSSGLVAGQGIWYDKVYNFYVEHNPKRLSSIGTVLRMYEGREKELMKDLHERYNLPFSEDEPASSAASPQLEPPPPSNPPPAGNSHPEASSRNYRHEVTAFLQEHAPQDLHRVEALLQEYEGRTDQLLGALQTEYANGSRIAADDLKQDFRSRVVAFYKQHAPAGLEKVDLLLENYNGREEELMRALHTKYDVPYNAPEDPSSAHFKKRVEEFYEKHNPEGLHKVNTIIEAYKGREEELMKTLHARYKVPYGGSLNETPALSIRQKLEAFCTKHNPDALGKLQRLSNRPHCKVTTAAHTDSCCSGRIRCNSDSSCAGSTLCNPTICCTGHILCTQTVALPVTPCATHSCCTGRILCNSGVTV